MGIWLSAIDKEPWKIGDGIGEIVARRYGCKSNSEVAVNGNATDIANLADLEDAEMVWPGEIPNIACVSSWSRPLKPGIQ